MDDILVARVMTSDPITVTADTYVEPAANKLLDNGVGSLIVVDDDGNLEGILTTTDFVKIVAASKPKAETKVERYMSTDVTTASAQDSIAEAAEKMIDHGIHHLPVVDDEEGVIGIVSTTDLAAYISGLQTKKAR
ncbi:CBS domain-containing protein [Haloparvum sp. PAK95]|uniref:CBS domain-containing protein n=1 Tax=Haloparvum sp. PAK95 TaxID=3418962 RepID=UPI003D2EA9D3